MRLYFVRSGLIELTVAGTLRIVGERGYGWSSRAYSPNTFAYNLIFDANTVYPSRNTYNRYDGIPLRCLSTVLDIESGK